MNNHSNNHELSPDSQVLLLLCSALGQKDAGRVKPFSLVEYSKFAKWLMTLSLRPAALLNNSGQVALSELPAGLPDRERTLRLLDRGLAMAIAVEGWANKGLWIICRSDTGYPAFFKQRLGHLAPPVLFGAGNRELLSRGGLAVVGSRDISEDGLVATRAIGAAAATEDLPIISGGARGVDSEAMLSTLSANGTSIGVLADSLSKSTISAKYREGFRSNRLALISAFDPDVRFMVGNAMARNKYIYSLSNWAVVVSSMSEKGGTWAGAVENLRSECGVPLFTMRGFGSGNQELIKLGASSFDYQPDSGEGLQSWLIAHAPSPRERGMVAQEHMVRGHLTFSGEFPQ